MRRLPKLFIVPMVLLGASGAVRAADVPIVGRKFVAISKPDRAKVTFVAKDPSITKGAGSVTDGSFSATLDIAYDSVSGAFTMPAPAWTNTGVLAKYKNNGAPTGGGVRSSLIRPALSVKVLAKSLGDTPLDISNAPTGPVYVAETIVNDAETTRLCTQFTGCVHKVIAAGSGYKLTCRGNSTGDAGCVAATLATTTTTSSSTSSTTTPPCSGSAVYGNAAEFSNSSNHAPDYLLGSLLNVPSSGTLTHLAVIAKAAGPHVVLALYSNSAGQPDQLIAATPVTTLIAGAMEIPVTATPLAAGDYWIMGVYDTPATIGIEFDDFVTGAVVKYTAHTFTAPLPNPFPTPTVYNGQKFNYYLKTCP